MRTQLISGTILAIAVLIGWYILHFYKIVPPEQKANNAIAMATYSCDGGKRLQATFYDGPVIPPTTADMPPTPTGHVTLVMNDGTSMILSQTLSADGARYANADESFVFWSKGNGAMILQNDKEVDYKNCVAK